MKKTWLMIILACGMLIIAVVFVIQALFHHAVPPSSVGILSINASDSSIALKGYFTGSAMWYSGYSTEYRDESLYIKIFASNVKLPYMAEDPFNISIPNTNGTIKTVYLQGNKSEDRRLIWSKNKP